MSNAIIIQALRDICGLAPACSVESVQLSADDPHERGCPWRDKLREAQTLARLALKEVGELQEND